ncbi:MAG TPA: alpha-1,4-glucan--maltose-1-phosphate maltosyltransferase [Nocardioidaceae bacterium]|nr:alpha-1,4-glucan--maltose-1-phosphate maltosyltransferase [Nocardioidaceae bacterium]
MVGRIPVIDVEPLVAGGYPAKAVVGEPFPVTALVFREGHDALNADVVLTGPDGVRRPWVRMRKHETEPDLWTAELTADAEGDQGFEIEAWGDPVATWRHDAEIKIPAGIDVELMFTEGALLLDRAAAQLPARSAERKALRDAAKGVRDTQRPDPARFAAAVSPAVDEVLAGHPLREMVTVAGPYPLRVDRPRALYGSWYEFFPRSEGAYVDEETGRVVSGTLRTAARRLDAVAEMGFDVVYLPPIHPIGRVNRKGANNTLVAAPDDVGSPWAIGNEQGGHDEIHPDLGTLQDFDAFVARARELGLEVAMDYALQCAPDHPWAAKHPEWFTTRADGTIAYAENPPKKYQDIYPVNFDNDPEGIYHEALRVLRHWMDHGVRIFRVDNPHTKPVQFWEWLLGEVRKTDPDVLFLAEAFTKPAMMRTLATIGFHQSYTYFTWRNAKWELEEYLAELSHRTSAVLRPNLFVNTPDILHAYLQYGGPAAFRIRATIAATASPTWGVYAGFELFEHVAVRPGSEEYLDSEKYQIRIRDWAGAEAEGRSLAPYLTRLNEIRRAHPALQQLRNLVVHASDDESVLVYSKSAPKVSRRSQARSSTTGEGEDDTVIVVVNVDPHAARETMVHLNMPALGLDWNDQIAVHDELTGQTWTWGERNYVRLDPYAEPAHILTAKRTHS